MKYQEFHIRGNIESCNVKHPTVSMNIFTFTLHESSKQPVKAQTCWFFHLERRLTTSSMNQLIGTFNPSGFEQMTQANISESCHIMKPVCRSHDAAAVRRESVPLAPAAALIAADSINMVEHVISTELRAHTGASIHLTFAPI